MDYDVVPYLFLKGTLVLELVAFLTSHMIDSRDITTLHEGIFRRCIYPSKDEAGRFNCLWWSADTYNTDRGSLKFVTILTFLSLFLVGFTCIYAVLSYYYRELRERARNFNYSMAIANALNVLLLLLILIIYTFVYATDTRAIGKLLLFASRHKCCSSIIRLSYLFKVVVQLHLSSPGLTTCCTVHWPQTS
jgi:hypothetical protein